MLSGPNSRGASTELHRFSHAEERDLQGDLVIRTRRGSWNVRWSLTEDVLTNMSDRLGWKVKSVDVDVDLADYAHRRQARCFWKGSRKRTVDFS